MKIGFEVDVELERETWTCARRRRRQSNGGGLERLCIHLRGLLLC